MTKFLLIECRGCFGWVTKKTIILAHNISEAKAKVWDKIGSDWPGKNKRSCSYNVSLYEIKREITDIEDYLNRKKGRL
jgi:hypothetical protein